MSEPKGNTAIHKGDLTAQPGVVYQCVEVTGYLDASGADTKAAFPKLTTVGGGLYASGADTKAAFPKLTTPNNPAAPAIVAAAFRAQGFEWHDGILSQVVRRRGAVTVVQVVGSAKQSYVVTDGTHTAHGDTLSEARADLRVKQAGRDTSAFKSWTPDTVVSMEDGIAAYRAITGACGAGVRQFLLTRKLPSKMPVSRILAETQGQYGFESFRSFIAQEAK